MVVWEPWEYRTISDDLQVGGSFPERPASWSGVRAIENTIETLLALNLSAVTGLSLQLLRRASAIEGSADIIATDPLGRVHIFELKKGSVSGQSAAQLDQYLLRLVFADADEYLVEAARRGESQTTETALARDIMCVWANERASIVGYKTIMHGLGPDHDLVKPQGHRLSKYRYERMTAEERQPLIYEALTRYAHKRGLGMPPLADIQATAAEWSRRVTPQPPSNPPLIVEPRLVLWLVGASISPDALERVRMWRRSGVDARVLNATARSDGRRWVLGFRRERAPQRTATELELQDLAALPEPESRRVKVEFYDQRPASTNRRHGGDLLEEPILVTLSQ